MYQETELKRFHLGEVIEVCCSSIYQWDVGPVPFCQTGNVPRMSIVEVDVLNLVTYIGALKGGGVTRGDAMTTTTTSRRIEGRRRIKRVA